MSKKLLNRDIAYQVIQLPKNNTFDFIFETGDAGGTKKFRRNANEIIVRLIDVPFPPDLTEEDLIKPRDENCDKRKVPNKFFIYRKWYTMCLGREEQKNDQTSISPYISEHWANEPQEVKDYYAALSKRAGKLFKERYGTDGFKRKTPKKIRKNKKNTQKYLRSKNLPKIMEENLNSTEPLRQQHQPYLSNNLILSEPSRLKSLPLFDHHSHIESLSLDSETINFPESQKSHSSEMNHTNNMCAPNSLAIKTDTGTVVWYQL
ncbi:7150_t:CDS:2 [Diversispora eburnea]|uniref:7150_t:CDS:1 n=1 Tax=Diversispora eburnea TaxID=1213867 RepID=A0A9N8YLS3_9GLOM|nr:7150_t:CDS:2 [Diversispora eburnea]